jgi:hypothetical protein
MEQVPGRNPDTLFTMAKHVHGSNVGQPQILNAERDDDDGLLVAFSDGTIGAYVVEELLELRPIREKVTGAEAWAKASNAPIGHYPRSESRLKGG